MGFWTLTGLTIGGIFMYFMLRKTAAEKLQLSDIKSLTENKFFGRKRFSLKLTNGKFRDLMQVKKESDSIEFKKLFESAGIRTT